MFKRALLITVGILFNSVGVLSMDLDVIKKIGEQIWKNEASGREDLLVFWNKKETFPSFGIGHNIWFPEGHEKKFTEGFPLLCDYLKEHGVKLPAWVEDALSKGAPWENREDFYNDQERIAQLRQLLVVTIPLQTQFMFDRMRTKLPSIIEGAPEEQREKVVQCVDLLLRSPQGVYVLVDYLNFKGDGLNPKEVSNGMHWGLLAVLIDMPDNLNQDNVTKAFTVSAAKKLLTLIEHSAPDYRLIAYLNGWMNRLSSYFKSSIC